MMKNYHLQCGAESGAMWIDPDALLCAQPEVHAEADSLRRQLQEMQSALEGSDEAVFIWHPSTEPEPLNARATQWWEQVTRIDGMPDHAREQMSFYARQWLDLLAPSNLLATNPQQPNGVTSAPQKLLDIAGPRIRVEPGAVLDASGGGARRFGGLGVAVSRPAAFSRSPSWASIRASAEPPGWGTV